MARVCVDSTYFTVDGTGQLTMVPGALGFQATVARSTEGSQSFNIADYPGASWVFVEVCGSGGGGAGAGATATTGSVRGGASGGTYAASWIQASTLAPAVTMTVGTAGVGGAPDVAGTDGGASSFGTAVIGPGGIGSAVGTVPQTDIMTAQGSASPTGGTGQIIRAGSPGLPGIMLTRVEMNGGNGGASGWPGPGGRAGRFGEGTGNLLANPGISGGGGAGAIGVGLGAGNSNNGGNGGVGFVRVTVYR